MPFQVVRQETAGRLTEVQASLAELRALNALGAGQRNELDFAIKRGLFLVILYASFEYALTRTIIEVGNQIDGKQISIQHLSPSMLPLALDPQFTSVSAQGSNSTKWRRRSALVNQANSASPCTIHSTSLTKEMGNIWYTTLEQVFQAFGITSPVLHDPRAKQYVEGLVEMRNRVAHGRESVADVGRGFTLGQLETYALEIEAQREYFIVTMENLIDNRDYIAPSFRPNYP